MTPPHADPAILTESLDKKFWRRRGVGDILLHPLTRAGRITALSDVSLSVRRGEIFGLLGPNGAGKTTLLKILCCLILPDTGRALVNGADTATDEMAVKRAIGYVASDERSFYWRLTGAQNLTFFARLQGVAPGKIGGLVTSLLERMELTDKAGEPFSSFSSGMKQRLSIARALLHEPPILYLDEPTRSLDPVTARHIRELVQGLSAREGKTVLLATHNLHEAEALCNRLAILSRSRIRRVGRLADFRALFSAARRYRLITDRQVDLAGVARLTRDGETAAGVHPGQPPGVRQIIELDCGDDGDLSPLLARLAASGARVLELTRQEDSLEDIFHQLLEPDDDDDGDCEESSA